jgi:hypothetical protein
VLLTLYSPVAPLDSPCDPPADIVLAGSSPVSPRRAMAHPRPRPALLRTRTLEWRALSGARRLQIFFDFAVELSFRPRFVVAKNADDLAPAALFASRGW